jgi:diguanylate cyclase (GGDEF)-like protein
MLYPVRIISTVVLCLLSYLTLAQDTNYKIELLNEDDGFVSSNIYSMIQDHQGFLWFGTAEDGLMKYDGKKVSVFESDIGHSSLSHNNAGNILLDKSGDIWVGTWGGGANRYDPKTNVFQHFKNDPNNDVSISSNRVQSLYQDAQGIMWFGTYANGLNRLSEDGANFERFVHDETNETTVSNNRIWSIRDAGQNSLWVGTSYGLNLYDKKTKLFTAYIPAPESLASTGKNQIRHILQSKQGELYVGTDSGVFTFAPQEAIFREVKGTGTNLLGRIFSLIEDRNGIIWAASDIGLFQLMPGQKFFSRVEMPNKGPIRIVFEDKQGLIWATSEAYGIYKISQNKNFFELNNIKFKSPNGLIGDLDGNLIIATADGGLFRVQKHTKTLTELSSSIFSLLPIDSPARKNSEWIKSHKSVYQKPVLHQISDSTLWFAQQSSLIRYNMNTGTATEVEYSGVEEVLAIDSTTDGRIWVGTFKNGLYVYDPSKGKFEHLMPESGDPFSLSHPEVLVMYSDKQNRLWIGTGEGLNLWDDGKKQFHTFKEQPDDETSLLGSIIQAIYQTSDGVVWVNNARVVLTEFQKMGTVTLLDKPFPYVEDIYISHHENFFSLEFSSLDLYAPQQNQYAYMLEGFDNEWVYIGHKNTASYTNLDGGTYLFKVKTARGDGEWSDSELAIRITITPPLWKTWWAYCLYILTIVFCLFLCVRYRTHAQNVEIQQQKLFVETLEQQVSQKTTSLTEKTAALEASNKELEELTYTDALSGLYNRRYFDRLLLKEITRHERQKEALALIICDIDFFKLYNDKYGHIVGDHCIQIVSECMVKAVNRSSDSICRYGGEEFALIMPNTDVEKAIQVVNKVMKALADLRIKHDTSPTDDIVTMSYGIYSVIPGRDTSPESMIESADKALYVSKNSGRNWFTVAGFEAPSS